MRLRLRVDQRVRLRLMAVITIVDTGVISYVSTRNLADRFGFGPLSWLYPLCLDAVAAVGMDLWMSNSRAQRPAKWLALSAVALSLAANVADWMFVGVGAAVLGAVPPLMLAALLLTMHRHESSARSTPQDHRQDSVPVSPTLQEQPASPPAAGPPAVPVPRTRAPRPAGGQKPKVPDAVLLAQIRAHEQVHGPLSRRVAMKEFKIGNGRAIRLLTLARNGHGAEPTSTGVHA